MRIPKDLVPQKVVAEDFCVSLVTLWRARKSDIPGFPEPLFVRSMIFWRKSDLGRLEDALLKFEGRTKFERQRYRAKLVSALEKERARNGKRHARSRRKQDQQSLF